MWGLFHFLHVESPMYWPRPDETILWLDAARSRENKWFFLRKLPEKRQVSRTSSDLRVEVNGLFFELMILADWHTHDTADTHIDQFVTFAHIAVGTVKVDWWSRIYKIEWRHFWAYMYFCMKTQIPYVCRCRIQVPVWILRNFSHLISAKG